MLSYIIYNCFSNSVYLYAILQTYTIKHANFLLFIKGSLDEKLPMYEQDPKSKRLDSFEKRFVRD